MQRSALVVLVVALGAIVFEFAALSAIKSDNPWLKALPAVVPFIALIATVFLSVAKDQWVTELANSVVGFMRRMPLVLYTSAVAAIAVAVSFGWYVWRLEGQKEGQFTVQIVERDDVPDQRVPGLPVTLEQKLRNEALERRTDEAGKASFDVGLSDIFAVRIRQSPDERAPVFVLASDVQVGDKKRRFELVRLAGIPEESWITRKAAAAGVGAADQDFAQLPEEFFRWHDGGGSQHVITVGSARGTFPFSLPAAETVIRRRSFTVGFSPLLRLPRWVAYKIVAGASIRRGVDRFKPDPELPATYQASTSDYAGNDFDRGHLVRRADLFGLGRQATLEVFYLSTVVPQLSYVNRRTWAALEEYATSKAGPRRDVYVLRGPIYEPSDRGLVNVTLMGASLVPVPTHFFQILVVAKNGVATVEAHIIPNEYVSIVGNDVGRFRASVRSVGKKTGLNFDPELLH